MKAKKLRAIRNRTRTRNGGLWYTRKTAPLIRLMTLSGGGCASSIIELISRTHSNVSEGDVVRRRYSLPADSLDVVASRKQFDNSSEESFRCASTMLQIEVLSKSNCALELTVRSSDSAVAAFNMLMHWIESAFIRSIGLFSSQQYLISPASSSNHLSFHLRSSHRPFRTNFCTAPFFTSCLSASALEPKIFMSTIGARQGRHCQCGLSRHLYILGEGRLFKLPTIASARTGMTRIVTQIRLRCLGRSAPGPRAPGAP